jgi:hypothetical protein
MRCSSPHREHGNTASSGSVFSFFISSLIEITSIQAQNKIRAAFGFHYKVKTKRGSFIKLHFIEFNGRLAACRLEEG